MMVKKQKTRWCIMWWDCWLLSRKISKMTFDITMPVSKAKTAFALPADVHVFVDALEVPAVYLQLSILYLYCHWEDPSRYSSSDI
jgi:hypothetical protein